MTENSTSNKMTAETEGRTLIMERIFDAPRDLVFKTFSKSEHLESWWGPKGWQTKNHTFEFKPNGVWHYCMKCIDKNQEEWYGQESWGKAIYHEVTEPEKIVYTDMFSNKEGHTINSMPKTLITMTFVEQEGRTKLTIRSQYPSVDDLQKVMAMGIVQGSSSQFDRLDNHLKEIQ